MPTDTDIANIALAKGGGAGDQESGTGIIGSIDGSDRVSARCKLLLPVVRRRVFVDLFDLKAPFKESLRYADLGAENAAPGEVGGWEYAFNVPKDSLGVFKQINEDFVTTQSSITDRPIEYRFDVKWEDAVQILLTDTLSNSDEDSAYIRYVFDQKNAGTYSEPLINCIATLLASELAPTIGLTDEKRQTLLAEYKTVCIPEAKKHNLAQYNSFSRTIQNYKGGRSESLPTV